MQDGTRLAAVDLGSNSFRLEIGQLDHGLIRRSDYLKETVRLGAGLDENRHLTPAAMQQGWDCLARFAERMAGLRRRQVRAVATQTLREARNRDIFLDKAQHILGFPIDVIPGREEARLIYLGVSHLLADSDERRLVVDIGGRSTEMILGQRLQAQEMESWRVGSVTWSMRYFPEGQLTERAFQRAEVAARAVLEEALPSFGKPNWETAYGSSGTVNAVADALQACGWTEGLISRAALDWLLDKLLKAQHIDRIRLEGLKEDRKAVIGGGLSVLRAIFDLLDISEMKPAEGALRHGVLYDLLDRQDDQTDLRSITVEHLVRKFRIDTAQAQRVSQTAGSLLPQIVNSSNLARLSRKLQWASLLHEIGSHVSHQEYHKHGSYILDHADAPGFDLDELHRLSQLVLGHRGKLRKMEPWFGDRIFMRQLLALRLAVILCHARRDPDLGGLRLRELDDRVRLDIHPDWSARFPQSMHLIGEEIIAWEKTPWPLQWGHG
jgi:exopolyphosphatase/guanosine-5'-triphosphate,3'-diphosphate pyrophosphatase